MKLDPNVILGLLKDQSNQLERMRTRYKKEGIKHLPVITICMEAGSGGSLVAQKVAERLGFDLFHREIIQAVAKSGHLDPLVLESMEKERLSGVQDFIASLLNDRYLWPGVYQDHLEKVVQAVAKRGGAVIVGRGANFILSPAKIISVRVVAPLDIRSKNVSRVFKVLDDEARRRILNRDSKRAAFVKKAFNQNIGDAAHYDSILNTGKLRIEEAVDSICNLWCKRYLIP